MSEDAGKKIGQRISARLKELEKTQDWLAGEMDIKPGYLSELMNGKPRKRWNLDLLESARKALKVPLSQLTGEHQEAFLIEKINQLESEEKQFVETLVDSLLAKHRSGKA